MYYVEVTTGTSQYAIPSGWEDQAQVSATGFSFIAFPDTDTHYRTTRITLQHTSSGKFFEKIEPRILGAKRSIGQTHAQAGSSFGTRTLRLLGRTLIK
jgi:hypothetical protein